MDMSLKELLAAVFQSLPVSTDHFVKEFLHVLHQDLFPCVVPVGVAATFMSVLSAVFVAYRWNRTPKCRSSEVDEGDASCTVGAKETERTHAMKTNPRSQVSLGQLQSVVTTTWINKLEERLKQSDILQKQLENELETARRDLEAMKTNPRSQVSLGQLQNVVTTTWINKLEERLKQSDILQKQLENELETARRDLETSHQQTDRKLCQRDEEVNKITEKLKNMTEEHNKQQSLLQESKREAESLIKENQELEKKLTEVRKDDVKQPEAEVLQQLKSEQLKREKAEKSLQELKTELDTKNQKLESLSKKVEILHEMMKKTEESQQVLMKELENHKNQKNPDPDQSAAVEELKVENMTSEITELRKEAKHVIVFIFC
ncbi:myosin-7B-like [Xiphophorus maculatus]|uniref:myosin-7B-like n=1 Tax=Xiphophorus maculatus TaxID=8083 RepID=UPI000C6E338D|nr:myosin-7B-like [Xiphophorus maculatus]